MWSPLKSHPSSIGHSIGQIKVGARWQQLMRAGIRLDEALDGRIVGDGQPSGVAKELATFQSLDGQRSTQPRCGNGHEFADVVIGRVTRDVPARNETAHAMGQQVHFVVGRHFGHAGEECRQTVGRVDVQPRQS